MNISLTGLLATLAIGLVAGWLASLVVGGGGLLKYIVWGLLGSVVGGFLLPALGVSINLGAPLVNQIVVSAIGAIVLVVVARVVS
ncbi:MAG: GlsB/YeaQ/YmgE family stress response membrane protein [Rhodobacterales bacterium]|nr:GlsB/YeaQ/YmgE family stress response membrane protein [Rhodobacterales bacterium]PJA59089.1 MAG: GlsB/YeaQ/YmgE family stress response membrane protein [Rhodobacterales bacterium CG_4_9_14_3_um_filter_71_31]